MTVTSRDNSATVLKRENTFGSLNPSSMRVVTSMEEFKVLRDDWNMLARHDQLYFPFLCFEWYYIWLNHFLKRDAFYICLFYEGSMLKTIAPFVLQNEKFKGLPIRKLELIGNVYSPIRNIISLRETPDQKIKDLSLIINSLLNLKSPWNIIDLPSLPREDDVMEVEKSLRESNVMSHDYFCFGEWHLDGIDYSGEEYFEQLPASLRKDILYCQRKLQKKAPIEIVVIDCHDEINHYMDIYYEIYSRSWQKKEHVGPSFHRDLAKMAASRGWLRLGFLNLGGQSISAQFWIVCNSKAFILKTAYDLEYKTYSPGKILTAEMFKYIIDTDKVQSISYVQGDEAYKKDWTPLRTERRGVIGYNNNIKGRYLWYLNNSLLPKVNENTFLRTIKNKISGFVRR